MKTQSYEFFGFLSFALVALCYIALAYYTTWNPYRIWIAACSVATFVVYGLDKGIAELNARRSKGKELRHSKAHDALKGISGINGPGPLGKDLRVQNALLGTTISERRSQEKSLARAPENLLHLLALLGGFPGGWFGMIFFGHKTNFRKHPSIWFFLALGTALHIMLTRQNFFGVQ
jgi:uncharacterized membrane protein YsdA (DUF1294 family)